MLSSQCPSSVSRHANRSGVTAKAASVCLERPTVAKPHRQQSHLQRQQQHHRQQQQQQQQQQEQEQQQSQQQLEHGCDTHQTFPEFEYTRHFEYTFHSKGFDRPKGSVSGRRRRRPTSNSKSSSSSNFNSDSGATISATSSTSNTAEKQRQWTPLHSKLLQSLRRQQVLPKHARVLVGVSGGQDSMAMLRLLHDLSQQQHWPLRLVVGHCDHRVRPDSADNAAFVQQYCEVLGLPYMQAVADRRIGHWAEAPARAWRQQQLARMASEACCEFLALGHTATERAETVLFNLIRGAGLRGVGAMGWSRPLRPGLQLVRPLLDFSRPETLQACELTGTEMYPDATNSDPRYVRNRLRMSVFPLLQKINSSAVRHICSAAEIARSEEQLMHAVAQWQLHGVTVRCQVSIATAAEAPGEQHGQRMQQCQQQQQQQCEQQQQRQQQCEQQLLPQQYQQKSQQQWQEPYQQQCHKQEGQTDGHMQQPWFEGATPTQTANRDAHRHSLRRQHLAEQQLLYAAPVSAHPLAGRHSSLLQNHQERCQRLPQHSVHSGSVQDLQGRPLIQHPVEPSQPDRTSEGDCVQGLSVPSLSSLHPALQRRVVQLWLSEHLTKQVSSRHVAEVLQLLKVGQGTGARTSSLWGNSCVLQYKQLLLVLDAESVQQVLSGQLQVQRLEAFNVNASSCMPAGSLMELQPHPYVCNATDVSL